MRLACVLGSLVLTLAGVASGEGAGRNADAAGASLDAPPVVVIDPGHGGADLGARGPGGELEKDVALQVAKKVAAQLTKRGARVLLTRSKDVFVPLGERTDLANHAHAELFVSIHLNSAPDRDINGSETYFLSLEASDAEAMRVAVTENDVFTQAGTADDGRDVVGAILGDLIRTEHLRESSELAAAIQRRLADLSGASRGVKQAPFVVLTGVNMPAALVEIGFVTNPGEAAQLSQRDRQDAIAKAVAEAIDESMMQNRARRLASGEPLAKESTP